MSVELIRLTDDVHGVLLVDGLLCCYTLELPWLDNARNISCVPPGEYPLILEYSPKFQTNLYELKDIPDRSEIKIHAGNTHKDISGCIALGLDFYNGRVLTKSKKAVYRFMVDRMHLRERDTIKVR